MKNKAMYDHSSMALTFNRSGHATTSTTTHLLLGPLFLVIMCASLLWFFLKFTFSGCATTIPSRCATTTSRRPCRGASFVLHLYFIVVVRVGVGYWLPSGPRDAFNFYHSQVRINIECAFGMLVHRWGILRRAIPMRITVAKTTALVMALCKLHNFCIDENDNGITPPTADDNLEIALHGGFDLSAFNTSTNGDDDSDEICDEIEYQHDRDRLDSLLDGGAHFDDVPRNQRRSLMGRQRARAAQPLPYKVMLTYVAEQGFQRPSGGQRVR